jgi:hypothetical protein
MSSPPSAKCKHDSDSPVSLQSSTSASTGSRVPLPQPQPSQQQPQCVSVSPAAVAVAEHPSLTSCTPRMHPRCLHRKPRQISCPTHHGHSRASCMCICRRTAMSPRVSPVMCSNRGLRHGSCLNLNLKRTRTVISNTSTSTRMRLCQCTHLIPQVIRARHTGHPWALKHTRCSLRRRCSNSSQQQALGPGPGQGQDGNVDIWHMVPSGYECVLFPFYSGAGAAHVVGDWLIGGMIGSLG